MPRINFGKMDGRNWRTQAIAGDAHYPDWNWSQDNSGIVSGIRIRATHVQDLRNRTKDMRSKLLYCSCTCDCTCTCQCTCTCTCTCTCNYCFG